MYPTRDESDAADLAALRAKLYGYTDAGALTPQPLTFTLTITLGNDGMQTQGDVRTALQRVANRLDYYGDSFSVLAAGQGDPIRDVNGNTVGSWGVK